MCWEHFYHGADIGVRGKSTNKAGAYAQAALAMSAVITDPATIQPQQHIQISCQAPDDEILFLDWLNALIYEMAIRKMLFCRFELELSDHHLQAKVWGEALEIQRHHPAVEIKGATFTELKVGQDAAGDWIAQCVVDV